MSDVNNSYEYVVQVKDISRQQDRELYGRSSIHAVSFSFTKKGVHCILAPKYSGKTQIMDILAGCDRAYGGDVNVLGNDPYESPDTRRKIGYVRKENTLYPNMTVFEIMSFVGESRKVEQGKLYRQIKEALELVGLDGMRSKLVVSLNEYDKKRLSLAAALLGNPELILLDEPILAKTSEDRREELERIISMLGRVKTVIVTTDDCAIARSLGEDVVIISDGAVLAKGSLDELDRKLSSSDEPTTLEALYNTLTSVSLK